MDVPREEEALLHGPECPSWLFYLEKESVDYRRAGTFANAGREQPFYVLGVKCHLLEHWLANEYDLEKKLVHRLNELQTKEK